MTKFSDLKLDPKVLKAVAEAGYDNPTPIQAGAIPPALEGRDVLGIAQTGTGKTASFTLPMITRLSRGRARARMPRSLVLCPTRELAAQVAENFDIYAKYTRLTKALLIGGVSFGEQDKLIDRGVDVLIATPGRLLDHFERGKLLLTGVEVMVVDEADRMLDMGFIPDIERIFQLTPFTRQTLFFSATMAPEIERITNTFLHTPERIEVARQATTSETITQKLVEITPTRKDQTAKQKRELLRALIESEGDALKNAIIFCNRKTEVDIVAKSLKAHGLDAAPIHGDLDQSQRMRTLDAFRDGSLRFLVASDVAARGLDIPAVSHVFNFDLPSHAEDYVHRIGRTGRAGRQGTAYSIATPADEKYLTAIEHLVKHALPRADAPEGFAISEQARSAPRDSGRDGGRDGGRGSSRSRSRSRRDDRREEPAQNSVAPDEGQTDSAPVASQSPQQNARSEGRGTRSNNERNEGRNDQRGDGRGDRTDGRGEQRGDRRNDRRHGDNRDGGRQVQGMGDHVPDFLKQSFAEALAATDAVMEQNDAAEAARQAEKQRADEKRAQDKQAEEDRKAQAAADGNTAADVADPAAQTDPAAEPAETQPVEAPKPVRRRRSKKAIEAEKAASAAEPEKAETVDGAAAGEAASGESTTAEKPKATRRRAPRKTPAKAAPAEATAEASAESKAGDTAATDAPPKPKRRSRKAAPVDPVDPVAPSDSTEG
ncbi:MAG: DEAD/DEAH box helicase [Paracoccus denitrificans]|uniref:DEAD-box ATP-dependent RNA helicase RhpA n=1 Tax=Paracoccus denitrificans TaxID=266 RepID=A0A533I9Z8_PARDE|nr:MAG: DEAD/DEAH box helicase [Paracoccus denitrificans]